MLGPDLKGIPNKVAPISQFSCLSGEPGHTIFFALKQLYRLGVESSEVEPMSGMSKAQHSTSCNAHQTHQTRTRGAHLSMLFKTFSTKWRVKLVLLSR